MGAGVYDLEIEQGENFDKVLTWTDAAGALVNLTGYTARMQVRRSEDATATLLECTTENSRISLGGVAGTITFDVSPTDMAALPIGIFRYDLELISGAGRVKKLMKGNFTVAREITR
jgi:hypothetical protein